MSDNPIQEQSEPQAQQTGEIEEKKLTGSENKDSGIVVGVILSVFGLLLFIYAASQSRSDYIATNETYAFIAFFGALLLLFGVGVIVVSGISRSQPQAQPEPVIEKIEEPQEEEKPFIPSSVIIGRDEEGKQVIVSDIDRQSSMAIYCTQCGTSLPNNAVFCLRCGSRVQEEPIAPTHTVSGFTSKPEALENPKTEPHAVHRSGHSSAETRKSSNQLLLWLILVTVAVIVVVGAVMYNTQQQATSQYPGSYQPSNAASNSSGTSMSAAYTTAQQFWQAVQQKDYQSAYNLLSPQAQVNVHNSVSELQEIVVNKNLDWDAGGTPSACQMGMDPADSCPVSQGGVTLTGFSINQNGAEVNGMYEFTFQLTFSNNYTGSQNHPFTMAVQWDSNSQRMGVVHLPAYL